MSVGCIAGKMSRSYHLLAWFSSEFDLRKKASIFCLERLFWPLAGLLHAHLYSICVESSQLYYDLNEKEGHPEMKLLRGQRDDGHQRFDFDVGLRYSDDLLTRLILARTCGLLLQILLLALEILNMCFLFQYRFLPRSSIREVVEVMFVGHSKTS